MKEKILELLQSTVWEDIEIAIVLSLNHLENSEIDNIFSLCCLKITNLPDIYFLSGNKVYRSSISSILDTYITESSLIAHKWREIKP